MNLLHLQYAVEIARTGSVTRAAENLYTSQPNMSRAVRELESDLGIRIFERTTRGIYLTKEGEEFIGYARAILDKVNAVESRYRSRTDKCRHFSLSGPCGAGYVACAFTDFVCGSADAGGGGSELRFRSDTLNETVHRVCEGSYRLGIIRYPAAHDRLYKDMLDDKGLNYEWICNFRHMLAVSRKSPLASLGSVGAEALTALTEVLASEPASAGPPGAEGQREAESDPVPRRRAVLFGSESCLGLLSSCTQSYMWVEPMPARLLTRYDLVLRAAAPEAPLYRDLLIYRKDYRLGETDARFLDALTAVRRSCLTVAEEYEAEGNARAAPVSGGK